SQAEQNETVATDAGATAFGTVPPEQLVGDNGTLAGDFGIACPGNDWKAASTFQVGFVGNYTYASTAAPPDGAITKLSIFSDFPGPEGESGTPTFLGTYGATVASAPPGLGLRFGQYGAVADNDLIGPFLTLGDAVGTGVTRPGDAQAFYEIFIRR